MNSAISGPRYIAPNDIGALSTPKRRAEGFRAIVRPVLGAVRFDETAILENPLQQKHGPTAELVLFLE